jgi:hypothetical protein
MIHSSHTSITNINKRGSLIMRNSFVIIQYSLTVVKSLQFPYNTDCGINYYRNSSYYYDECVENYMKRYYDSLVQCYPYYYISNITGIGFSKILSFNFERERDYIDYCYMFYAKNMEININSCKRDCIEEYYSQKLIQERIKYQVDRENLINIIVIPNDRPIFTYELISEYSFVSFASNIGGLLSLWLGFAFIDIYVIIKLKLKYIKISLIYIYKSISKTTLHYYAMNLIYKLIIITQIMSIINYKFCIKIVCFLCFIYQFYETTHAYLQFLTSVNIDYQPVVDNFGWVSINKLPSFTICYNYFDIFDTNNISEYNQFIMLDITCKITNNLIASNWITYWNAFCTNFSKLLITKSSDDKICVTLLSDVIEAKNYSKFMLSHDGFAIRLSIIKTNFNNNLTYTFSINPTTNIDNNKYIELYEIFLSKINYIFFEKIIMNRLPPPFNTNCRDYGKKTRDHCLNDCMISYYIREYGCVPILKSGISLILNNKNTNNNNNYSFCTENIYNYQNYTNQVNSKIKINCNEICLTPCYEEIYFFSQILYYVILI